MKHLYKPSEIEQIQQDIPYLIQIKDWVENFLGTHHPNLGRPGPVCPCVPHALKTNSIQMAVIRAKNFDQQQVEEIVKSYRDLFLEADKESVSQAYILIFPDIPIAEATQLIDSVQRKLKPIFVTSGLMIGEFHSRNESPGLHNQNFRSLRSPIPLLAIRYMVEADLPFLQSPDDPHLRIRYLEAYLKRFGYKLQDEPKIRDVYQTLALAKAEINGNIPLTENHYPN
jgi:hypothetical protein